MRETTRRALLYGGATPLLAAMVWAGFVYEAEPDLDTLLGAANVQMRLAYGMPERDRDGRPVPARLELIESAARNLARARLQAPESPILAEFDGFLCQLQGEPRTAAAHYRRARELPDCGPEQHDVLVFNEARMLRAAGAPKEALAVFEAQHRTLAPALSEQCCIERAELLHQLGRDDEALPLLQQAAAGEQPMAWMQAGVLFARMGDPVRADAILGRAAEAVPIADYHRAHLKLVAGDVDTCLRLLGRAAAAVPAEVRRMVREDASAWQALDGDARFRELVEPTSATPGR
ncbi:MAG: hypothetical protein AB7O97_09335 [Planctomycetota bacterium]